MLEMILTVCLIDNPARCKDVHLNSAANYSQCMNDQPSMAKWVGDNPNWVIKSWHCNGAKQEATL